MLTLQVDTVRNCWEIDWTGDAEEAEIRRLFGTVVLPTMYTLRMPRADVVAELAKIGTVVK